MNPAGVKQDKYYFNDGNEDQGWDAVWDVVVAARADGWSAEFRIPLSQLRFPTSAKPTLRLRAVAADRAPERDVHLAAHRQEHQRHRVAVRRAARPRALAVAQAARACAVHRRRSVDRARRAATRSSRASDPGASVGLDMKYAITPALTLTATVNPDFGQVEADPGGRQPQRVRDVLSRAPAVLRRRIGRLPLRHGLQRRQLHGPLLHAPHRPAAAALGRRPRRRLRVGAVEHDHHRRDESHRADRRLLGRHPQRDDGRRRARTRRRRRRVHDRHVAPIEPFASYTVGRARREFANQSAIGLMMTATNRNVGDERSPMRVLANSAYAGGVDWDLRLARKRYAVAGYWAGTRVNGTEAAIARLQENNVHSFQRPDATHVEFDPTRTTLSGPVRLAGVPQDLRRAGAVRVEHRLQDAGLRQQRPRLHPARRPDHAEQLAAVAARQAGQVHPQLPLQPQSVGRPQLRRRPPASFGGNVNAHWSFKNNWSSGFGHQPRARQLRRPRDARRAGRQLRGQLELLELPQHRQPQAGRLRHVPRRRRLRVRAALLRRQPGRHLPADPVAVGERRLPVQRLRPRRAVGDERGGRRRADRTTCSRASTSGPWPSRRASTTRCRRRCRCRSTPSRSSRPAPTRTTRSSSTAARTTGSRATRPTTIAGNADFNYRSFRTTNVLRWEYRPGSSLFVVWQQGREDNVPRGDFRFGRDFSDVFSVPASNVFLVKFSYWLNY